MRISISHGNYCSDSSFRAFRTECVALLEVRFSNGQNGGKGCSWEFWGALGALPSGMLQPPWHVTAAPACYRTLFSYIFFQAGLLHAALGSLLRLSSSLSSLSCLLDSPSGRFFQMFASIFIGFYANKSNLNMKTSHSTPLLNGGIYRAHLYWEERCWKTPPVMPQA